jgi:uncharacterized protein
MAADDTNLKFPCDFPIKIVGVANDEFEISVLTIFRQHFPDLSETAISARHSRDNKYLSLTVTVHAHSKEQLDKLYQDLTACEQVLMAL